MACGAGGGSYGHARRGPAHAVWTSPHSRELESPRTIVVAAEYGELMPKTSDAPKLTILEADCRTWMQSQPPGSIRCVITSPPYNLGIAYSAYEDNAPRHDYLEWLDSVFQHVRRVLHDEGHFFLNVGYSNSDPWVDFEVAAVARKHFFLQNRITWVKNVTIEHETHGHFKPINSSRFLNATNEII